MPESSAWCLATSASCGSSSRQGAHQVAQKLSTMTFPFRGAKGNGVPSKRRRTKSKTTFASLLRSLAAALAGGGAVRS